MPVWVIDTLKPKNGLDFPVVEAVDVAVEGYLNLADAVTHFATQAAIAELTAALNGKADTSDIAGLQAQINQIEISASAEAVVAPEVAAARVGADGTSYATLKARLDAEQTTQGNLINQLKNDISYFYDTVTLNFEQGWVNSATGELTANTNRCRTTKMLLKSGEIVNFTANGMYYNVATWTGETFNGNISDSWIEDTGREISFSEDRYVVIGVRKADNTDITPANVVATAVDNIPKTTKITADIQGLNTEISNNREYVDSYYTSSINLFNKNSTDIISDSYITNTRIKDEEDSSYRVSHAIPVKKGVEYKFNISIGVFGEYSKNILFTNTTSTDNYIIFTGEISQDETYVTFTAPKTGFIRFNQAAVIADVQMFCESELYPVAYTEYYNYLKSDYINIGFSKISGKITKDQSGYIEHIVSENVLNPNDITSGHYLMPGRGQVEDNANYFYTYIPIATGTWSMKVDSSLFGNNALRLPLYDANKDFVGTLETGTSEETGQSHTQSATFTVSDEIIRTTGAVYFGYSEYLPVLNELMVVNSDTYPSEHIPYANKYILDSSIEVNSSESAQGNTLYGKKVVFDGDSICSAGSEGNPPYNGWPYRIGHGNSMMWYNTGVGGGTIAAGTYYPGTEDPRHWISRYIDTIHQNHSTLDFLILEGGTNDADILGNNGIGTLDVNDYSGSYDDTNFTGALDSLFYKALNYYPGAKIGFIIAHKMGVSNDYTKEGNTRRRFFERAMDVCKKWGIPYINLWDSSPLNPKLPCYYDSSLDAQGNRDGGYAYTDGQHLTGKGYDIISPKIEAWMRTL